MGQNGKAKKEQKRGKRDIRGWSLCRPQIKRENYPYFSHNSGNLSFEHPSITAFNPLYTLLSPVTKARV